MKFRRHGPFMGGRSNDYRELDMQRPPHIRERLMELYAQWDELLATLRQHAAKDRVCISNRIKQARCVFDDMRRKIISGDDIARLEKL